jgi:ribosomal protein S27AE
MDPKHCHVIHKPKTIFVIINRMRQMYFDERMAIYNTFMREREDANMEYELSNASTEFPPEYSAGPNQDNYTCPICYEMLPPHLDNPSCGQCAYRRSTKPLNYMDLFCDFIEKHPTTYNQLLKQVLPPCEETDKEHYPDRQDFIMARVARKLRVRKASVAKESYALSEEILNYLTQSPCESLDIDTASQASAIDQDEVLTAIPYDGGDSVIDMDTPTFRFSNASYYECLASPPKKQKI